MHRTANKLNISRVPSIIIICSVLLSLCVFPVSAVESGRCSEGINWALEAGTLTITGVGEMPNYRDSNLPPWYEFREEIVRLNISDKISSIGSFAFYGCKNLVSVYIPNSVKTIGSYAFASCNRLASVQMSGSVSSIGDGAFYSCYALESIRLPYGLSYLGSQAFYRCESLTSISIPSDVRTMGDMVFAYCYNLVRAEVYARIKELPAWTFYGCSMLTEVCLAETISDIDNNGFKNCDSLSTVFYSGTEKQTEKIKEQISNDVSSFDAGGYITDEKIPESTISGNYVEQDESTSVYTDTVVLQNDSIILNYTVERTYTKNNSRAKHSANIVLTVESEASWKNAGDEVIKALNYISSTYAETSNLQNLTVTVYVRNNIKVSRAFLNRLAGRDIVLTVILSNASSWSINCRDLKVADAEEESVGYSHTIKEAPADVVTKLETNDCYRLIFDETIEQKAEVLVQLPTQTAIHSNAFLYQIEEDGSYKKLQAVAVDNSGKAHFYIASADKYTDYIIGLNVKGEDTSDIIIPNELMAQGDSSTALTSALARLENVTYVETGRNYSMGFGYNGLTWILIGVLSGTTAIVGGIMIIWNKSKKTRIPEIEEQNIV